MSISLLNKFRGAWLGSYGIPDLQATKQDLVDQTDQIDTTDQKSKQKPSPWAKLAVLGAESLISLGYLDLDHYQEQIRRHDPQLLNLAGTASLGEAVWATLPVVLFFHEQPYKLVPELLSVLELWLRSQESIFLGLEMGQAIALLLGKNPHPTAIMTHTDLGTALGLTTKFWQELPCLASALKEISLQTSPSQRPLAIAWYCFLCTPEDFSLSIRRAALTPLPAMTTVLVGIISGAYNGLGGMPFNWYWESMALSGDLFEGLSGDLPKKSDRLLLINQLFTTWSGHYQSLDQSPRMSWRHQIVESISIP